jgi:hypothetical protein
MRRAPQDSRAVQPRTQLANSRKSHFSFSFFERNPLKRKLLALNFSQLILLLVAVASCLGCVAWCWLLVFWEKFSFVLLAWSLGDVAVDGSCYACVVFHVIIHVFNFSCVRVAIPLPPFNFSFFVVFSFLLCGRLLLAAMPSAGFLLAGDLCSLFLPSPSSPVRALLPCAASPFAFPAGNFFVPPCRLAPLLTVLRVLPTGTAMPTRSA